MAHSPDNELPSIHKVDTVPPPDGETDAYSAPTRVGPLMPTTAWAALLGHPDSSNLDEAPNSDTSSIDASRFVGSRPLLSSSMPESITVIASSTSVPEKSSPDSLAITQTNDRSSVDEEPVPPTERSASINVQTPSDEPPASTKRLLHSRTRMHIVALGLLGVVLAGVLWTAVK